jgi:hypothetical protein
MGRLSGDAVCLVLLVIVGLAACSRAPAASPTLPQTGPSRTPSVESSPSVDPGVPMFAAFDAARFATPTMIDNKWLPLTPGRRWITSGVTIEGGERIPHRITFTVTTLTKVIDGIATRVVWIEDFSDGELVEKEIAFYAQDDDGTVWYFGEHPEEYEDGEFVAAPTWIAGVEDARPGVKMFADPTTHTQSYYQGWGPAVEWSDFGRLDETGILDCVAFGCYGEVVRFAESSDGEEGIFQLKSYARGTGEIRVGWRGAAETREELELRSTAILKGAKLADIEAKAIALEERAYTLNPKVYGDTSPMRYGLLLPATDSR